LNKSDAKIFEEVSMGGRFGKYGDATRKAQIPKNWLKRRSRGKMGDVVDYVE